MDFIQQRPSISWGRLLDNKGRVLKNKVAFIDDDATTFLMLFTSYEMMFVGNDLEEGLKIIS